MITQWKNGTLSNSHLFHAAKTTEVPLCGHVSKTFKFLYYGGVNDVTCKRCLRIMNNPRTDCQVQRKAIACGDAEPKPEKESGYTISVSLYDEKGKRERGRQTVESVGTLRDARWATTNAVRLCRSRELVIEPGEFKELMRREMLK